MRRTTIALLIGLLTVSCKAPTMLTVSQTALSYENGGGSQSIVVTANKMWTARSDQGWLRVSPPSGEGESTITISCEANTSYDTRTGTITLVSEELSSSITVTQAEGLGLLVQSPEYNLSNEAQVISVNLQANVQFSVDIEASCRDWIKQGSTKGLSSKTIEFEISKNDSYDDREGKITIRQTNGSLSAVVIVRQSQTNGLFVSTPKYALSNEQHILTIEVKANIDFEVIPEVDWIRYVSTKGLKTSQITLEVANNEEYDRREGTVVVKQRNGDLTGVITIMQDENQGFVLPQTQFEISCDAQTLGFDIEYNVPFDVVIPDECKSWITQINTKGLESKYLTFSISKNETYDNRDGSITIKQKDGSLSGTVTISQSQASGLFAEKASYEVSASEQVLNVKVKSNIDYQVKIDESCQDWISLVTTKGLSESVVSLMITENVDKTSRTGKVVLVGNQLIESISITQQGSIVIFGDDNFESYCIESFDRDGDGVLSLIEARDVTSITVGTDNILSLSGIEFFSNLESLECVGGWDSDNKPTGKLASLDLSKNTMLLELDCSRNQLIDLDVSNNPSLVILGCDDNQLKNLKLGTNTVLLGLSAVNNQLTNIDISNCVGLEVLYCDSNKLTSLNLNNNTALIELECGDNYLTSINVSANVALEEFFCERNQLSSLDVSNNTALRSLDCDHNNLSSLDVRKNTALTDLSCVDNRLSNIDIITNILLDDFNCAYNQLKSLDVSNNTELRYLHCYSNELTKLDVRTNTKLRSLNCNNNQLVSLDISNNQNLESLDCCYNLFSSLNVSNNAALNSISCNNNPYLKEIWLKTTQKIQYFQYDRDIAKLYYVDFSAPSNVKVSVSGRVVYLSWNAVTGAVSYYIYYSNSLNGELYYATKTDKASVSWNAQPGDYYFYIKAVSSGGQMSDYSNPVYCTVQGGSGGGGGDDDVTTPPAPSGLSAYYELTPTPYVYLSWNSVNNASNYLVYRSTSANGSYSKIGENTYCGISDYNVSAGKTYYYKVKASNRAGTSDYSSYISVSLEDSRKPGPVQYGNCTATSTSITLRWTIQTGSQYGKPTKIVLRLYDPTYKQWVDAQTLSGTDTSVTFNFGMWVDSDGYVKCGVIPYNDYGSGGGSAKVYDTKNKRWIY